MFNLKKAKSKVAPTNKALQKNREQLDGTANDNPATHEGLLDEQRKGLLDKTTEAQMDHPGTPDKEQIAEKKFEREKIGNLYVPSINTVVTEAIKERRSEFTGAEEKKADNWTLAPTTQNGSLPEWPKIPQQHEKKVLPNDVDRDKDEALLGGKIHKASVDNAAFAIKNGLTRMNDEKIVKILSKAFGDGGRDLTEAEKTEINRLKTERTKPWFGDVL